MLRLIVSVLLVVNCSLANGIAQDGPRRIIDPKIIPLSGAATKDFVPQGWKIEQEISGDLNADNQPDAVVQLIEDKPEKNNKGEYQDRYRVLLILLKSRDGKFQRGAVAVNLLQCTGCGGILGSGGTGADLKIEKGVLIVSQLSGSREMREITQRFRFDPVAKRFVLIGQDVAERDRATGKSTTFSTNFLTGKQVIEKTRYNQKTDKEVTVSKTTKIVPKAKKFIEAVDYEQ